MFVCSFINICVYTLKWSVRQMLPGQLRSITSTVHTSATGGNGKHRHTHTQCVLHIHRQKRRGENKQNHQLTFQRIRRQVHHLMSCLVFSRVCVVVPCFVCGSLFSLSFCEVFSLLLILFFSPVFFGSFILNSNSELISFIFQTIFDQTSAAFPPPLTHTHS